MKELRFRKSCLRKEYSCQYVIPIAYIAEAHSKNNYEEAGKELIRWLVEKEPISLVDNKPFYLTTIERNTHYKPVESGELNLIKNSLDKFIQENKLNIELKVA